MPRELLGHHSRQAHRQQVGDPHADRWWPGDLDAIYHGTDMLTALVKYGWR